MNSVNINIQEKDDLKVPKIPASTTVTLTPYSPSYSILWNGKITFNKHQQGYNSYIMDFDKAYSRGDTVTVTNNGFRMFSKVLTIE